MTDATRLLVLALQVALLAAVAEGVRRRDIAVTVNALGALAVALLPALLRSTTAGTGFTPQISLWIAAAGALHSLGMLGLYESTWWWDHLAHTVSGGLVAALAYTGLAIGIETGHLAAIPVGVETATITFVALTAIGWELLELLARVIGDRYGIDPVLVHYGRRDTALDLVFTLAGAVLVVLLDLRVRVPIAESHPAATATVVTWSAIGVVAASVAMAAILLATRSPTNQY